MLDEMYPLTKLDEKDLHAQIIYSRELRLLQEKRYRLNNGVVIVLCDMEFSILVGLFERFMYSTHTITLKDEWVEEFKKEIESRIT
jgi:hypothetical protein